MMPYLLRPSLLLMISTGASAGGGFVAWTIAAHASSPHVLGVAAGLFSSCSLLSYVTSIALPYGLLRYGHLAEGAWLLRFSIAVTAVTSGAAAVIFAFGARWWAPALASQLDGFIAIALFALLNAGVAVAVVIDAYLVARRHAGTVCVRNAVTAAGKIVAVAGLATAVAAQVDTLYLAMLVPTAISAAALAIPLAMATARVSQGRSGERQEFMRFSVRNYPGALLDGAPTYLLPLIALRLIGPTANAYFYISWSVAGVVGLIAAAVGQIVIREAATARKQQLLAKRAMALGTGATGLAVLILWFAAPLVLHIFGSAYSGAAVGPLRILLVAAIPGAHLTITIALLRGQKRYAAVTQASMAYAVLVIAAIIALGIFDGVNGVCLGWLGGVTVAAALAAVLARRPPHRDVERVTPAPTLEEAL